ncbi:MAG: CAP domain-containing protein [Synechococcus sp. SB0668_bin_13]|nr:CAP domain-containing protein [Cyanobacteria bacterium MAG IRC3_bin_20]MDE0648418.1 CAP domain-containing protein [Cyanobacteria bacterium MAG IRC4_bin_6]MXW12817.1 CAP domain-containing protein [Synechococcus sp. SB0668_bin_13]
MEKVFIYWDNSNIPSPHLTFPWQDGIFWGRLSDFFEMSLKQGKDNLWMWIFAILCIVTMVPATAAYGTKLLNSGRRPPYETGTVAQAQNYQTFGGVRNAGPPLHPPSIETWIIHYTNSARKASGLRPLTHDPAISNIAREHSQNMISSGIFAHDVHGKSPTDRALEAGYNCRAYNEDGSYSYGLSENIYEHPRITEWSKWGTSTEIIPTIFHSDKTMGLALVRGWMSSPGHRKNILDRNARRIGVGVAIKEHQIAESSSLHQEIVFATQNFSACR